MSTPDTTLVSIIIVNFKNYELTRECLKSLLSTNYSNFEIILVDNESDENSLNDLQIEFKDVKFLPSSENLYYAGGNNYGLSKSKGEFVCLLNNDTIVTPDWLTRLLDEAQKNPYALYQPKILLLEKQTENDTKLHIGSAGNTLQVFGFAYPEGLGLEDSGQFDKEKIIFYPSGACTFTSRKMLDLIGGLDSNFFTYYEDVNLGWKTLLLGYKSYYIPKSIIFHKWGASFGSTLTSTKFQFIERGRICTLFRNLSLRSLILMFPSFLIIESIVILYSLSNRLFSAKLKASIEILQNFRMLMNERREIQKKRKMPDKKIINMMSLTIHHPYVNKNINQLNMVLSFLAKIYKNLI